MHLLDAWTMLPPRDLLRLLALPFAAAMATFLPGRVVARTCAIVLAFATLGFVELGGSWLVRAGWSVLWAALAWWVGRERQDAEGQERRRERLEAWVLGLPLGVGVLLLLLAALSRQVLMPSASRLALIGVSLVALGMLHLLTRRHVRRAVLAFAFLALGIESLAAAVRETDVLHEGAPAGAALASAILASALLVRLAHAREVRARAPLVSDAHDLHD